MVIGCLGVVGIVFFAIVAALIGSGIGGGSSDSAGSVDMGTSATIAQNDCHDQVTAKLGSSGLAYSGEDTVADHNGKGPAIMVSGTVAQNGAQYFFQCSATAVAGGKRRAKHRAIRPGPLLFDLLSDGVHDPGVHGLPVVVCGVVDGTVEVVIETHHHPPHRGANSKSSIAEFQ